MWYNCFITPALVNSLYSFCTRQTCRIFCREREYQLFLTLTVSQQLSRPGTSTAFLLSQGSQNFKLCFSNKIKFLEKEVKISPRFHDTLFSFLIVLVKSKTPGTLVPNFCKKYLLPGNFYSRDGERVEINL